MYVDRGRNILLKVNDNSKQYHSSRANGFATKFAYDFSIQNLCEQSGKKGLDFALWQIIYEANHQICHV